MINKIKSFFNKRTTDNTTLFVENKSTVVDLRGFSQFTASVMQYNVAIGKDRKVAVICIDEDTICSVNRAVTEIEKEHSIDQIILCRSNHVSVIDRDKLDSRL